MHGLWVETNFQHHNISFSSVNIQRQADKILVAMELLVISKITLSNGHQNCRSGGENMDEKIVIKKLIVCILVLINALNQLATNLQNI